MADQSISLNEFIRGEEVKLRMFKEHWLQLERMKDKDCHKMVMSWEDWDKELISFANPDSDIV